MILAWPLLVLVAWRLARQRRDVPGGRGRAWFAAWAGAGFLMSFSLVTGFSIGLFVLPFAAVVLLWTSTRSPHAREAAGFAAGIAATVALLVALHTVA